MTIGNILTIRKRRSRRIKADPTRLGHKTKHAVDLEAEAVVAFLRDLMRYLRRVVIIVWDRLAVR